MNKSHISMLTKYKQLLSYTRIMINFISINQNQNFSKLFYHDMCIIIEIHGLNHQWYWTIINDHPWQIDSSIRIIFCNLHVFALVGIKKLFAFRRRKKILNCSNEEICLQNLPPYNWEDCMNTQRDSQPMLMLEDMYESFRCYDRLIINVVIDIHVFISIPTNTC
jgi:hypothetical protein